MQKLAKRNVPLRGVKYGAVEQSGKQVLQLIKFSQGIETEKAKAIVKLIKDSKLKVQAAADGQVAVGGGGSANGTANSEDIN